MQPVNLLASGTFWIQRAAAVASNAPSAASSAAQVKLSILSADQLGCSAVAVAAAAADTLEEGTR